MQYWTINAPVCFNLPPNARVSKTLLSFSFVAQGGAESFSHRTQCRVSAPRLIADFYRYLIRFQEVVFYFEKPAKNDIINNIDSDNDDTIMIMMIMMLMMTKANGCENQAHLLSPRQVPPPSTPWGKVIW